MTIFRCKNRFAAAVTALSLAVAGSEAGAQVRTKSVILEPLSSDGGDVVQVRNIYGRCGTSVVQVLGVRDASEDFYTVDSGAGNADIIVIREGGRSQVSLKKSLSDYNGVSCLKATTGTRLLVWSNCGGSICGNGFSFTIVDPDTLEIVAGKDSDCNALCASRLLGSDLPLRLDHLKLGQTGQ